MALTIPNLDTKDFNHFVEENQASLPALAPEWTDYNLSDPGITLLELFAWLSDINMYRLNRIDNKHLLKYLKLLGSHPKSVVPSTLWLSFETIMNKTTISKNSTFMAQPHDSDLTIPFIIERDIQLHASTLTKISLKNERGNIQYKDARFPIFFYPFGELTGKKSHFELLFDNAINDAFSLTFILYEEGLPLLNYDSSFKVSPSALLSWSYCLDEKNDTWETLDVEDETHAFSVSGSLYFSKPTNAYRHIRCVLVDGRFENAPRVQNILTNTIQAIQIKKNNEIFNEKGTGLPHQTVTLAHQPVLKINELKVDNEVWLEADNLELHNHHQKIYTVDKTTGVIQFGDNVHGMPLPYQSTVDVTYESSYGINGNIAPYVQWSSENLPTGAQIKNHFSAKSGQEPQSIHKAFIAFQKALKTPSQAVTAGDFEYLSLHTPNLRVARAKAHAIPDENLVKVTVIPFSLQEKPYPEENFLKTVCRYVEKQRLITTQIEIIPPHYVLVSIEVEIKLKGGFKEDESKRSIEQCIATFLHPLRGWKDGNGWPFGQDVYRSDIYNLLEEHAAVDCVNYLDIQAEGKQSSEGSIILNENELTLSHQHKISFSNPHKVCRSQL